MPEHPPSLEVTFTVARPFPPTRVRISPAEYPLPPEPVPTAVTVPFGVPLSPLSIIPLLPPSIVIYDEASTSRHPMEGSQ